MLFFYFQFDDTLSPVSYSAAAQYGLEFVDQNADAEDTFQTVLFLSKVKTT